MNIFVVKSSRTMDAVHTYMGKCTQQISGPRSWGLYGAMKISPFLKTPTVLYQGYTINQKTLQKWYVACAVEASNIIGISVAHGDDESNH